MDSTKGVKKPRPSLSLSKPTTPAPILSLSSQAITPTQVVPHKTPSPIQSQLINYQEITNSPITPTQKVVHEIPDSPDNSNRLFCSCAREVIVRATPPPSPITEDDDIPASGIISKVTGKQQNKFQESSQYIPTPDIIAAFDKLEHAPPPKKFRSVQPLQPHNTNASAKVMLVKPCHLTEVQALLITPDNLEDIYSYINTCGQPTQWAPVEGFTRETAWCTRSANKTLVKSTNAQLDHYFIMLSCGIHTNFIPLHGMIDLQSWPAVVKQNLNQYDKIQLK